MNSWRSASCFLEILCYLPPFRRGFACFLRLHLGPSAILASSEPSGIPCLHGGDSTLFFLALSGYPPTLPPLSPLISSTALPLTWFATLGYFLRHYLLPLETPHACELRADRDSWVTTQPWHTYCCSEPCFPLDPYNEQVKCSRYGILQLRSALKFGP